MAIAPVSEETKARIAELHAQGLSGYAIAKELGIDRGTALKYGGSRPSTFKEALAEPRPVKAGWWQKSNRVLHDDGKLLEIERLPERVLAFSCTQAPLHHPEYLPFLAMVIAETKPTFIIQMGDLMDLTFAKPKFSHPDDMSPTQEIEAVRDFVQDMRRVIGDEMLTLTSNHDSGRVTHMQKQGNVPSAFMKTWQEVYGYPEGWVTRDYFIAGNMWLWEHGNDVTKGSRPSIREEMIRRFNRPLSVMRAHRHGLFGPQMVPEWETPTWQRQLCYVGTGMDSHKVFYTRSGLWNGCILLDRGVIKPYPMERDKANRWTGRLAPWDKV